MKKIYSLIFALCAAALPSWGAPTPETGTQDEAIATLQSDHSLAEKDAACARLKWIGDAKCVPVLAGLLTDDQLSHSARYALESMQGPEAEAALIAALPKLSGSNQVGLINSLGVRKDEAAVPALAPLLSGSDANAACATAMALGRIAGPQSLQALQAAWSDNATGALHNAEIDGLLACANKLLADGQDAEALKVFQELYDTGKTEGTRQAAYCGVILSSGPAGIQLMANAIAGSDGATQGAALQTATKLNSPEATQALADLLPKVQAPVQIALLECLQRRGDASALKAVATMIDSPDADVRMAAINAMSDLGDGSVVKVLAEKAASASGAEKLAARQALLNLRRGDVTPALLDAFTTASPQVKPELIKALGDRGDDSASPKLLEWARAQDDAMRASALQALAVLAGPAQLPDLVQIVVQATSDDARSEAADALSSACQRIEAHAGQCDVTALAAAVQSGPAEARLALLPVCSGLTEAPVRDALRASLKDSDARIHEAALRALCDTHDGALLPDLLQVAGESTDSKTRMLAIRGAVRLSTQEDSVKLSNAEKLATMKKLLEAAKEAGEKRQVLSGLGSISDPQSLAMTVALLDDAEVRPEASEAIIKVSESLASTQPKAAGEALTKVLAVVTDPGTLASAQETQKKIWHGSGYVTMWMMAGPYSQPGKSYSELFDIPFPPESGDDTSARWEPLPANTNSAETWKMDLLQAIGGEQRVAYARTWVNSPKKQSAHLELGSDDGIKVWVNNRVVFGNNTSRGLQPGADTAEVTLNKGWNRVMVKVTQNINGWGFCVRIAQPDGQPVTGLRVSAQKPAGAKNAPAEPQ